MHLRMLTLFIPFPRLEARTLPPNTKQQSTISIYGLSSTLIPNFATQFPKAVVTGEGVKMATEDGSKNFEAVNSILDFLSRNEYSVVTATSNAIKDHTDAICLAYCWTLQK